MNPGCPALGIPHYVQNDTLTSLASETPAQSFDGRNYLL